MPLVTCPDCENSVSSVAPACPHCGRPHPGGPPMPRYVRETQGRSPARRIVGIIVPGVALMGLAGWGMYQFFRPASPPQVRPDYELVDFDPAAPPRTDAGEPSGSRGMRDDADSVIRETQLPPDADTYELSAVEVQPELVNRSEVAQALSHNYPPLLRDAGVTGTAVVRMRIRADGTVDVASVTVEQASHAMFGDAASNVVKTMRFRPARVGGKPVSAWVTLPVTFQLQA